MQDTVESGTTTYVKDETVTVPDLTDPTVAITAEDVIAWAQHEIDVDDPSDYTFAGVLRQVGFTDDDGPFPVERAAEIFVEMLRRAGRTQYHEIIALAIASKINAHKGLV